jgi:hypothetical protein
MRGIPLALCGAALLALVGCDTGEGVAVPQDQPYVRSVNATAFETSTIVTITADDRAVVSTQPQGASVPRVTSLPPREGRHAEARALAEAAVPRVLERRTLEVVPACQPLDGTRMVELSPPANGIDAIPHTCWETDVLELIAALERIGRE